MFYICKIRNMETVLLQTKFHMSLFSAECPTCWTEVDPLLILHNRRRLVILTPSAWAASFNNSNIVCPCPHYALVGLPCTVEVLKLLGYCVHIKNKAFLALSSILLKNDPFSDCTVWMSDRQKQLMCSQLGIRVAEVNSSSDCSLASPSLCSVVYYCVILRTLLLSVQEYSIIFWKLLDFQ